MLPSSLVITQDKANYDNQCKHLISHKFILARILSYVIDELNDMEVHDIIRCIEADPKVGSVPVNPGEWIEGRTNDLSFVNEGENTFDIFFNLYVPVNDTSEKRLINIEIQNKFRPGYPLENRAEFYASRMLSMQYGIEMTKMEYGKLKKAYSLWINTNPTKEYVNTIYRKKMIPEFLQGDMKGLKENKLMNIIMMNLGKPEECTGVLRMLAVALSNEMVAKEKIEILEKEYGMRLKQREAKEMEDMCDLADAIERKGIEKGLERGHLEKISFIIKLLKSKLGTLTNDTIMSIKMASQENLERLAENFMKIESEEEIQNILLS